MFKNILLILILVSSQCFAQNIRVFGKVTSLGDSISYANLKLSPAGKTAVTDSAGNFYFNNLPAGKYDLKVTMVGYLPASKSFTVADNDTLELNIELKSNSSLNEVVVSGTLKEVNRLESPVPVEVFSSAFFKKNPTPSIFDALQNVNGVRPQINCNVCNTGDIHINGMEGPYTMVLIDGMPIVSSLSTVYGLSGIPNSLIEQVEIVKGPASSLYGSEAVGGLINIITKKPAAAPKLSLDVFGTSWSEWNSDVSYKLKAGRSDVLTGINYYNYTNPIDKNSDNFTDVTQQNRISIFQKWTLKRKQNRIFSLAGRYFYEDRWGGEMNWKTQERGGDRVYGESIYTSRWELLGNYQLPIKEKLLLSFSFNSHDQNSVYGKTTFIAHQKIAFSQLTWDKKISNHDLLAGTAFRYTLYDDNTTVTGSGLYQPEKVFLPGIFVQDDISLHPKHNILLGARYDYNSAHGNILTPRFAYRFRISDNNILRLNAGTGFRVVNLFTEDHAALTGARKVEILEDLRPEKSYNVNLNFIKKIFTRNSNIIGFDITAWYTKFSNRIIADYSTDPDKVIYGNLKGYAISNGLSLNADYSFTNGIKIMSGFTLMDVKTVEDGKESVTQMLTEPWMGTWAITYPLKSMNLSVDYTGNIYGPMKLPLTINDVRSGTSPVWSLQNIQLTWKWKSRREIYGGVKNLLNWTPNRKVPYLIAASDRPFSPEFDTSYVYAPNQGIRGFLGLRLNLR